MAMKYSWFQHPDCTTEQAEQLVSRYQARGIVTEKSLNADYLSWTVSARLPVVFARSILRDHFVNVYGGEHGQSS